MIPNYLADVIAARARAPRAWAHAHREGDPERYDFIRLLAADLHARDPRVGLNGKRGDPRDISMDALNIRGEGRGRTPEGDPCVVVDVITGAGGPDPQPAWTVFDDPMTGSGAWVRPEPLAAFPSPPPWAPAPPPPPPPYPGDAVFDTVGTSLFGDYAEAGVAPNPLMGRWFGRIIYDWLAGVVPTLEASIEKHRREWREILGRRP